MKQSLKQKVRNLAGSIICFGISSAFILSALSRENIYTISSSHIFGLLSFICGLSMLYSVLSWRKMPPKNIKVSSNFYSSDEE